jgi:cytoskeletal protein RodZ
MTSTGTHPAARPRRRAPGRSFAGLLWALIPVLVVLVGIVVWQQAGERQPLATVDPTGDIAYARRVAPVPFPALGPVPDGWRATSSQVEAPAGEKKAPVTLTVGYVTPAGRYAEIVVTDQAPPVVLGQVATGATADGTTPVGAARWERYRSSRGETVLVHPVGAASVLVTGDAADADLVALAATAR